MKLNETAVRKLPPPTTGYILFRDDELTGFAVRVTAQGAKSFTLNYTVDGRERRMTIGKYPPLVRDCSPATGERAASANRPRDRSARRKSRSVARLQHSRISPRNTWSGTPSGKSLARWTRRCSNGMCCRCGADARLRTSSGAMLSRSSRRKPSPPPSPRIGCLGWCAGMFNWAISRDLLEYNPCIQVRAPAKE